MDKVKFGVAFAAGITVGAVGTLALQAGRGRGGGRPGGEILLLPMILLLIWTGYCLRCSREKLPLLMQDPEEADEPETDAYQRGYDDGYTDAVDVMAYTRPPRKRPTKKRRRADRQTVPERSPGA